MRSIRELHTECVNTMVTAITVPAFEHRLSDDIVWNRKLDRVNGGPAYNSEDFNRLRLTFRPAHRPGHGGRETMKVNRWPIPHNPVYKVGDRVLVKMRKHLDGTEWLEPAVVIEDRGLLGRNGAPIARVRFLTDAVAAYEESEYPPEFLQPDPNPA